MRATARTRSSRTNSARRVACMLALCASAWPQVGAAHAPGSASATGAFVAASEPVAIDGLAAVIGGAEPGDATRSILRSDVELRARLSLLSRDAQRALLGELPGSLLRATLDQLLGEQLIAAEAERVQITEPRPADVARELAAIERESGGRRAVLRLLARLDASQLELDTMARRRALISAFLRANLEGVTVVTEHDVDARLQADMTQPSADTSSRAAVRALIAQEALTRNIDRWVRVLRARTPVRVFAVFEAP
jgi:hypothetical protein